MYQLTLALNPAIDIIPAILSYHLLILCRLLEPTVRLRNNMLCITTVTLFCPRRYPR